MIKRVEEWEIVDAATKQYQYNFDPHSWVSDYRNMALINDHGDINLFQYERPGAYMGHFFYRSRGRAAIDAAREMLAYVFSRPDFDVITGLTPVENKAARWISRKLGFTSHGEIETIPGRCELFVLTKSEYERHIAAI